MTTRLRKTLNSDAEDVVGDFLAAAVGEVEIAGNGSLVEDELTGRGGASHGLAIEGFDFGGAGDAIDVALAFSPSFWRSTKIRYRTSSGGTSPKVRFCTFIS